MSEAESPIRKAPGHEVTVDDIRQLVGASTPHFALQIRNRIARLIRGLPRGPPRPDRGRARDRPPARAGRCSASSAAPPTRRASSRWPRWTSAPRIATRSALARPAGIERAVALLADPADRGAPAPRGWLDLIGAGDAPASTGLAQDLMLSRLLPVVYERWWRPALEPGGARA